MASEQEIREAGEALLELAERGESVGLGWVCRWSTTGRGLRLYQQPPGSPWRTYATPQEAVIAFTLSAGPSGKERALEDLWVAHDELNHAWQCEQGSVPGPSVAEARERVLLAVHELREVCGG